MFQQVIILDEQMRQSEDAPFRAFLSRWSPAKAHMEDIQFGPDPRLLAELERLQELEKDDNDDDSTRI